MKNIILTLLGSSLVAASAVATPPAKPAPGYNLMPAPLAKPSFNLPTAPQPMPRPVPAAQLIYVDPHLGVGANFNHQNGASTQVFVHPDAKAVEVGHTFPKGNSVGVGVSPNSAGASVTILTK